MKENNYLEIIKCIYNQKAPSSQTISALSLKELYDFFCLNKCLLPGTKLLSFWSIQTPEEKELVNNWKAEATQLVFLEYQKHSLVKHLQTCAQERRLPLLFFKGYVLADLYPSFTLRNSSDTDIYIDKTYKNEVFSLLSDLHYTQETLLDEKDVFTFFYKKDNIILHKIELHTSLYEDLSVQQCELLDNLHFSSLESSISLNCCQLSLNTLNHQNHLLYQILHMVKHLGSHGFPARYLIDTSLFIQKYHKDIHWDNLFDMIKSLGYQTFYQHFLSILIHHFDVPKYILKEQFLCTEAETSSLLFDILHFGMRSKEEELSHYFFYFEKYIEKLQTDSLETIVAITFDGNTVPPQIVPLTYQKNPYLKERILMLKNLDLL